MTILDCDDQKILVIVRFSFEIEKVLRFRDDFGSRCLKIISVDMMPCSNCRRSLGFVTILDCDDQKILIIERFISEIEKVFRFRDDFGSRCLYKLVVLI